MLRYIVCISLLIISLTSCSNDKGREYSIRYPVKLVINSDQGIKIKSIYSHPESKTTFILNSGFAKPNKPLVYDISYSAAEVFTANAFSIEALCNNSELVILGESTTVEKANEAEIHVSVDCP